MSKELNRRSLTKSLAWTVPAVVVSGAAPALAASCNPSTNIETQDVLLTFDSVDSIMTDDLARSYYAEWRNSGTTSLPIGSTLVAVVTIPNSKWIPESGLHPRTSLTSGTVTYTESYPHDDGSIDLTFTITLSEQLSSEKIITLDPGFETLDNSTPHGVDKTPTSQSQIDGCNTVSSTIVVTAIH